MKAIPRLTPQQKLLLEAAAHPVGATKPSGRKASGWMRSANRLVRLGFVYWREGHRRGDGRTIPPLLLRTPQGGEHLEAAKVSWTPEEDEFIALKRKDKLVPGEIVAAYRKEFKLARHKRRTDREIFSRVEHLDARPIEWTQEEENFLHAERRLGKIKSLVVEAYRKRFPGKARLRSEGSIRAHIPSHHRSHGLPNPAEFDPLFGDLGTSPGKKPEPGPTPFDTSDPALLVNIFREQDVIGEAVLKVYRAVRGMPTLQGRARVLNAVAILCDLNPGINDPKLSSGGE